MAEARKTVTVVFADVTGSTSLGERLDPEALRRIMGRYFEEMRAALERHGGTVEKFIGDAVMAVFGIPSVHEDDALRAVRAAVEMRDRLAALNDELERDRGITLDVRTGVNTGEVVAGDPGGGQFFATGDAVNVAARLEQAAAPGEILLGVATQRLVCGAVDVEPVKALALKGKSEAVPAWRLLAVVEGAPGFARRLDSPLVGREQALARLRAQYDRVRAERTCRLVTVLGSAGLGKSRLVAELVGSVEGEARILVGRCLSYGDGITFWPLAEIVRSLGDVDDRVAAAVGLRDAATNAEETFWAVRKLFERLAREQPLVLVFDDVHWAEPAFLDLLDHVTDWSRDASILILCLARPELLEARPAWAAERDNATAVRLEPLTDAEAETLVTNLLGRAELPDALRRRVTDAAEGNPLFVEQMLAMVEENGHSDGAADLSVPPTIQALLAARLDRLPPEERLVIEAAAVVGKEAWRGALVELLPDDTRVSALLQSLVRKEFVTPERSSLPGEDAFRFRHVLIRDAAYAGISKEARAAHHERFADWLELTGSEYEEIVGYHLEQAYGYRTELGPADAHAVELAQRAGERLGAAGKRADLRGDMGATANLLGRALALLPVDSERRFQLAPDYAWALENVGRITEAEALLAEIVEDADRLGRAGDAMRARVELASIRFSHVGDASAEDARGLAGEAMTVFKELDDDLGLARAWRLASHDAWAACRWGSMRDDLERALTYAERTGELGTVEELRSWIASAHYFGPTPVNEAIANLSVLLRESAEHSAQHASTLTFLGGLYGMVGDFEEGRSLFHRGLDGFRELGMLVRVGGRTIVGSRIELLAGRPAAAEDILRDGYRILTGMNEEGLLSTVSEALAEAVYLQGRYGEAEELTHVSERISAPNDMSSQIGWRATRARVFARRGRLEEALRLSVEALDLVATTEDLYQQAGIFENRAEVLELAGQIDEARKALHEAVRLFEAKGATAAAERARRLVSELGG